MDEEQMVAGRQRGARVGWVQVNVVGNPKGR